MINVWDWVNQDHVEIVTVKGSVFRGNVIEVSTAEDDNTPEDTIALETNSRRYCIMPSEIKSIQHY